MKERDILDTNYDKIPDFGAAVDVDADCNRVYAKGFAVSPSDTLAVFLSYHKVIDSLNKIKGVARTMPTSQAVDVVAEGLCPSYETPTGWKYFVNLLNDNLISLCGEESFGIGGDHIREKDGIWTVLVWLTIIAEVNKSTDSSSLISLKQILENHWNKFGRNYYCKYDYEEVDISLANEVFLTLNSKISIFQSEFEGGVVSDFEYYDKTEDTLVKNQGLCFIYPNKSRFVFRKSGTSSYGVTIRIYFERYEKTEINLDTKEALKDISKLLI